MRSSVITLALGAVALLLAACGGSTSPYGGGGGGGGCTPTSKPWLLYVEAWAFVKGVEG